MSDWDGPLEELIDCVLLEIVTARALDGPDAPAVTEMKDAVALAALNLVNVICELPARDRPEGWEPDPGAVTA